MEKLDGAFSTQNGLKHRPFFETLLYNTPLGRPKKDTTY
jgi:hypothetical protein